MDASFDAAPRTRVMTIDRELEICRAIQRQARRIALRMQLRRPLFEIQYFLVKRRLAALKVRRYFVRNFLNAIFYAKVHGRKFRALLLETLGLSPRRV